MRLPSEAVLQITQQRFQIPLGIFANQKDRFELWFEIGKRQILLHGNQLCFVDFQSVNCQNAIFAYCIECIKRLVDDAIPYMNVRSPESFIQRPETILRPAHHRKGLPVQISQTQAFAHLERMRARNQDTQRIPPQNCAQKFLPFYAHIHQV